MVIEHTLFFFLGYLFVQVAEIVLKFLISSDTDRKNNLKGKIILFWTRVLRMIFTVNRYGYVFSFIVVGAVGFLAARSLGESFKLFALFALNGIMGFAGLMLSIMDTPIYLVYSVHSHNNAGIWMLITDQTSIEPISLLYLQESDRCRCRVHYRLRIKELASMQCAARLMI